MSSEKGELAGCVSLGTPLRKRKGDTWAQPPSLVDPRQARKGLAKVLREARRISGRSQVFLELYAGQGIVARFLSHHAHAVFSLDLSRSSLFDLTNPAVLRVLQGWITSKLVLGIFMAPPCTTFSNARGL